MVEETNTTNTGEYWIIPRARIRLETVLDTCGFKTKEKTLYVLLDIYDRYLKAIAKFDDAGQITITYDRNNIQKALELRKILDLNRVPYKEEPSRKKFARILKNEANEKTSLADILAGT